MEFRDTGTILYSSLGTNPRIFLEPTCLCLELSFANRCPPVRDYGSAVLHRSVCTKCRIFQRGNELTTGSITLKDRSSCLFPLANHDHRASKRTLRSKTVIRRFQRENTILYTVLTIETMSRSTRENLRSIMWVEFVPLLYNLALASFTDARRNGLTVNVVPTWQFSIFFQTELFKSEKFNFVESKVMRSFKKEEEEDEFVQGKISTEWADLSNTIYNRIRCFSNFSFRNRHQRINVLSFDRSLQKIVTIRWRMNIAHSATIFPIYK